MSATATAQTKPASSAKKFSLPSGIIILALIVVAFLLYNFVLGNPNNFEGGNVENHPVPEGFAHWLGIIHKGGVIVPVLLSFFLMVLTFSIERLITITLATGTGSVDGFVRDVKGKLATGNLEGAKAAADKQKGSVGNVIKSVLNKYGMISGDTSMDKDQKVASLQKELEEATSLELPMLEQNLAIIATLVSVSTLVGLLGTVLGMIKAFSALANAGAPDSAALSTGISEALINTALGIGTSAIATIAYNYFTSKIDGLTYNIDEIGFSIMQNFASKEK
jgi:biopolymer transport protein ExbB